MKILSIKEVISYEIETDHAERPIFRRYGPGVWEVLMGNSWEEYYQCEELELAYKNMFEAP